MVGASSAAAILVFQIKKQNFWGGGGVWKCSGNGGKTARSVDFGGYLSDGPDGPQPNAADGTKQRRAQRTFSDEGDGPQGHTDK